VVFSDILYAQLFGGIWASQVFFQVSSNLTTFTAARLPSVGEPERRWELRGTAMEESRCGPARQGPSRKVLLLKRATEVEPAMSAWEASSQGHPRQLSADDARLFARGG
jgi:hypothetical protein